MIHPMKVNDIISKDEGEGFEFVQKYETIDAMYGMDYMIVTDEDIKALKGDRCLYYDNGEYALLISYKKTQAESEGPR